MFIDCVADVFNLVWLCTKYSEVAGLADIYIYISGYHIALDWDSVLLNGTIFLPVGTLAEKGV